MADLDLLRDARQDAALAVRQLVRYRGFALVALVTLALGIGAPTAIFSVVRGVLLRPLPYADPDRVVTFRIESDTPAGPFAFDAVPVSLALEWAAASRTLGALSVYNDRALSIATVDGPVRLSGVSATPALFDVLQAQPRLGRVFSGDDDDMRQIVLADGTWRTYYAADPGIIGRAITLDGQAYRVTGVMPEGFGFPTPDAAFWVPQQLSAGGSRGMVLPAVARLAPGVGVADVVAEGTERLDREADSQIRQVLTARTLKDQIVGPVAHILWVLMAAVAFVAVIATVNIALLLLTRGASRSREFAIRLALGAGRGRLTRQLFVEGFTLAVMGGIAGLLVAVGGLNALLRYAPADLPRVHDIRVDGVVLAFALGLTFASSLVFGVLSAGRLLAIDAVRRLTGAAAESRLTAGGPSRRQLRSLAAVELALTAVLLVGAGLLLRSFVALVLVPQGFDARGALAFGLSLPAARYPSAEARLGFLTDVETRLARLPGVTHVAFAADMPNRQPTARFEFSATGVELLPQPFSKNVVATEMVSEGFFEAIGIRIASGRGFTAADTVGAEPVIVISRLFAAQQFGDAPAVGHLLYSRSGDRRVVGVVDDVHPAQQDQAVAPMVYLPLRQQSDLLSWHSSATMVVRATDGESVPAAARAAVLSLDPQLPVNHMRWLSDELAELTAGPRFSAAVLSSFAAVALVMASIGVYGVMGVAARQRRREIGVRLALGATRGQVLVALMRDGFIIVGAGLLAGLLAAVWLARSLAALLHDVTPADPASLIAVGATLAVAGLTAALIPVTRATRLNVLSALRED